MKLKISELKQKQSILGKVDLSVNDKLTYAIKRLNARIDRILKPRFDDVQETITDFTIDQASVDEKGQLILNGDKHSFTPQAKKALMKFVIEQNHAFDDIDVEIDPFLIADVSAPGFQRAVAVFDDFDVEELTGLLF